MKILERQLRRLTPGRIWRSALRRAGFSAPLPRAAALSTPVNVCVICPAYPSAETPYGGQFVRTRVQAYARAGLRVLVVVVRPETQTQTLVEGDLPVWRTTPQGLQRYLKRQLAARLVVHHPEHAVWDVVAPGVEHTRPLVIIHGYEARPWRTLESSYSASEITALAPTLDERDAQRRQTIAAILSNAHARPIFVSHWMREVALEFAGLKTADQAQARAKAQVIHNPILAQAFPAQEKSPESRKDILWMRSFQSHNYANDLARDAVLALAERPDFSSFNITVRGEGQLWDEITEPLRAFENVDLQRGVVPQAEVAALHVAHGVMLVPSRWESQGLTLGEAMSSGLVAVTTRVAAVPEFISDAEGLICPPEDARALANALGQLADDPVLFQTLSRAAAERAQAQCGAAQTVDREIALLRLMPGAEPKP